MAFQLISAREAEYLMDKMKRPDDIDQPDYIVIDLRDNREYSRGHIAGAMNLPYDFLDSYIEKLPKKRRYILYCSHGAASMIAGRRMSEHGLDVLSISGGILSYRGRLFV